MEREEQLIVARALAERIGMYQARKIAQYCKDNKLSLQDFIQRSIDYIRTQQHTDISEL